VPDKLSRSALHSLKHPDRAAVENNMTPTRDVLETETRLKMQAKKNPGQ